MIKRIKKYWERVKDDLLAKRRYIDVYIAVATSFVLFILDVFGRVKNQKVIFACLLALLAIFAKAILDIHWQNEDILKAISKLKDTRSLAARFLQWDDSLDDIQNTIKNSSQVFLWGYTLRTHLQYLKDDLETGAAEGKEIKIILLEPSSDALKMAAVRQGGKQPLNKKMRVLEETLRRNLETLRDIKAAYPNSKFDFKVLNYFAPYTMYVYDYKLPQGSLMVRLSEFEAKDTERTTYYLTSKDDSALFKYYVKQFDIAWEKSKAWI